VTDLTPRIMFGVRPACPKAETQNFKNRSSCCYSSHSGGRHPNAVHDSGPADSIFLIYEYFRVGDTIPWVTYSFTRLITRTERRSTSHAVVPPSNLWDLSRICHDDKGRRGEIVSVRDEARERWRLGGGTTIISTCMHACVIPAPVVPFNLR